MKNIREIHTDFSENHYFKEVYSETRQEQGEESQLLCLYPEKKYQKLLGFGGAFTEAAASVWKTLGEEERKQAVDLYFSKKGLGYTMGRLHINSCDFSLENYTYVEEGDQTLETFSVEREEQCQIPLLQAAKEAAGRLDLLASPWSPPAYMKTNGEMNHGGKLKREYWKLWAEYIARYLTVYKEKEFPIGIVTIQNEPKAVQIWDSCIYTPEEEREFAQNFLAPALKEKRLDTKILAWDHNKERLYEQAKTYFEGDSVIDGEAFHWYSGDHFEQLRMTAEDYPDKLLIFTEGCVEYSRYDKNNGLKQAEMYAHDMIGNLSNGCCAILDWNLFLDEAGGPNHVGNYCAAPVMMKEGKMVPQSSYYYIGHLSRYIQPGAVRIGSSSYTAQLEQVAFQNPDGSIVSVLLNRSEENLSVLIKCKNQISEHQVKRHSIVTVIRK